jgi:small subunit ribosomal protein S4
LKGERCYTDKCAIERRNYPPGEHGQARPKFSSTRSSCVRSKKLRRIYGVLEAQFRRYFTMADRAKGVTGELLLQLLERRLDGVVYRLGFSTSRSEVSRQLVRHGHVQVNGRKVDVPSALMRVGDTITVREARSREIAESRMRSSWRSGVAFPIGWK